MSQLDTLSPQVATDSTAVPSPQFIYYPFHTAQPRGSHPVIVRVEEKFAPAVYGKDAPGVVLKRFGTVLRGVGHLGLCVQVAGIPSTRGDNAHDPFAGGYWSAQVNLPARSTKMPAEVAAFCRHENIQQAVDRTVELVEDCFSPVDSLAYRLSADPDDGGQRVVIRFTTGLRHEQALEAYDRFIGEWIDEVSRSDRTRILVSYDTAHHEVAQVL